MGFLALTLVDGGRKIYIRHDDVRAMEVVPREIFADGEWKATPLSATLIRLKDGVTHTVVEPATAILKELETPR